MSDPTHDLVNERRREMAIEHLLFHTIRFLARRSPELLDELDASVQHLWDRGAQARDDEEVREIARRFLSSLRRES
jgi:hypothetical protein